MSSARSAFDGELDQRPASRESKIILPEIAGVEVRKRTIQFVSSGDELLCERCIGRERWIDGLRIFGHD